MAVPARLVVSERGLGIRRVCRTLRLDGTEPREASTDRAQGGSFRRPERGRRRARLLAARDRADVALLRKAAGRNRRDDVDSRRSADRIGRLNRSAPGLGRIAEPFGRRRSDFRLFRRSCPVALRALLRVRLRLGDADPSESSRSNEHSRERNPLEHGFPLWFRGCCLETDAPHRDVSSGKPRSNQRTMGETREINDLGSLISGFPVSVTKPYMQGDLRSAVCRTS